jgi:hypothetical protein
LAELDRQLGDLADGLGIFAVHVEDGDFEHPRDVGGVAGRASVRRKGGEADLVVDDDVDGAARLVTLETSEVERFCHDALPHERSIAVDEQRHDPAAVAVAAAVLLGANTPLDHRVHPLEVARVEGEGEVHLVAR